MTTTLSKNNEKRVARPLRELVPLIKDDLRHGQDAAQRAGMPYYIAAGAKLIEAKSQLNAMSWGDWISKNFHLTQGTARVYMRAAEKSNGSERFETLNEVRGDNRKFGHAPTWTQPVRDVLKDLEMENLNMRKHEMSVSKEEKLERSLGMQLIDIGYKVLAVQLHPDKGGSHDAMQRLNRVRALLRRAI